MSQSSDYDDFIDAFELDDQVVEEEAEVPLQVPSGRKTRGKDIDWELIEEFANPEEFRESQVKAKIDSEMFRKKSWKTQSFRNEHYLCKYSNKIRFLSCKRQLKIVYFSSSFAISSFENSEDHVHEENETSRMLITNGL